MRELEANLGIVNQQLREVQFAADAMKSDAGDGPKGKEREARSLVRKLNEDRRLREAAKME